MVGAVTVLSERRLLRWAPMSNDPFDGYLAPLQQEDLGRVNVTVSDDLLQVLRIRDRQRVGILVIASNPEAARSASL